MQLLKRVLVILPVVLIEAILVLLLLTIFSPWAAVVEGVMRAIAFFCVLFMVSYRQEGAYKIVWILLITAFPLAGALAYLLFGGKRTVRPIIKKIDMVTEELGAPERFGRDVMEELKNEDPSNAGSFSTVENMTGYPAMTCESAVYYPLGEDCWHAMLEAMRCAKEYIYLEYFIVQEGEMWKAMREIMAQKVKEGVDVRFMYDDLGSLSTFTSKDGKALSEAGIKWLTFNKLRVLTGTINNRSHRKMLIIDGKTAFSGGINLADEYINLIEKYGHWKDIGFKITGPAVGNYLNMFARFWNGFSEDKIPASAFEAVPKEAEKEDGAILSYYDSPANRDAVSRNMFTEMLGNARGYAWFYTPYLMLADTLLDAFVRAAKRGVDVRIIVPGVPDKKLAYQMTQSYFYPLLEAGVKIYKYTPGFVHAKASLYDDEICTIGTVNLDYRSLYLHFENNSIFWQELLCKGWFHPPNTYDCGSFVVN